MLINLSQKTLMEFSSNPRLLKEYSDTKYQMRDVQKSIINDLGIKTYSSFLKFINAVAPLEDEVEIYRYWHGYFFSEYFIDFISSLLKKIETINITPFQDEVFCKCPTCGAKRLTPKKKRNAKRGN